MIKWETIKNRCVRIAYKELNQVSFTSLHSLTISAILDSSYKRKYENTTIGRSLRQEITEEIVKAIDNWDIRQFNALKKVFPDAFPKNLQGGMELTEKGWVIV